jgi:hypothetical protein
VSLYNALFQYFFSEKVRKYLFLLVLALEPAVERRVLLWRARSPRRQLVGRSACVL